MLNGLAGIVVQARTEASKGFELFKLGIGELEIACYRPVCSALRFTTDP